MNPSEDKQDAKKLGEMLLKLTSEQLKEFLKEIQGPPVLKKFLEERLEDLLEPKSLDDETAEPRMRRTMETVARTIEVQWSDEPPAGHPYGAQLDGSVSHGGKRIGVVELEAKNPKQVRGALLDLLSHPERKKILVIGRSKAVPDPRELKEQVMEEVLPVLQELLASPPDIQLFTEAQLMREPSLLAQFLGLP